MVETTTKFLRDEIKQLRKEADALGKNDLKQRQNLERRKASLVSKAAVELRIAKGYIQKLTSREQ